MKSDHMSKGYTIFTTLFFAFCILFIIETIFSTKVINLGIDTISPENLKEAPESFRLSLQVESRDFPVEEMKNTQSWVMFQKTVTGYAKRLELLERQNRYRRLGIAFAIGVLAFQVLSKSIIAMRKIISMIA